ncbi:MAG: family 3 glycosyl hydrolase, partial [Clostridia bacterium]|nr:family 3 glycosyl hydrolase [Clostridia bacterium]
MRKMSKKRKRIFSAALSLSLCVSILGQIPLTTYANESEESQTLQQSTSSSGGGGGSVGGEATPIYSDYNNYSFEERAADMISKMSITQKASQMNGSASPSITLSDGKVIPAYGWWNEALHGVARYQYNGSGNATTVANATSYPIGLSLGSSWDPELMYKVAVAIGDEARDTAPDSNRMLTFYSPTINLARDTRWGRTDETFSEDPLLTSEIAGQFVNGFEGKNMDGSLIDPNGYLKSITTIKHYTANNSEVNRLNGSSDVTDRELREFYTKPYRDIIKKTDAQSIMNSYNAVNGVPVTLSQYIMETLLRQTFGFTGYVTTDCDSIAMAVNSSRQNYTYPGTSRAMTSQEGYAWAAMFGVDLVCNAGYTGSSYGAQLPGAAAAKVPTPEGIFTENAIDINLLNLYTARMKLGEFDDTVRDSFGQIQSSTNRVTWYDDAIERRKGYNEDGSLWTFDSGTNGDGKNMTQERLDIARESAAASLIMLRNNPVATNSNNPVLPVSVPTTGDFKVVVYGPNANYNTSSNSFYLGGYSSNTGASMIAKMVNPYNGIKAEIQKINPNAVVEWKKGFTNTGSVYANMTTLNQDEINLASGYDLAIVCLGTEAAQANEDADRGGNTSPNNLLPGAQIQLANAVAEANPKMVTVIESTSTDDLSTLSSKVPALLWSGYNGQVKGLGLADVLLGKYNPSGRTSTLWFANNQFPSIRSYRITPGMDTFRTGNSKSTLTSENSPGRTYMYYDGSKGEPLYPFGYGLSYSTFEYSNMVVTGLGQGDAVNANGSIQVSCDIKNTSNRDGHEIIELYASTPDSTKTGAEIRPIKRLVGFKKVMIKAGATEKVTLNLNIPDLRFYDETAGKWVIDNGRYNLHFSTSNRNSDIKLNKDINVSGVLTPKVSVVTAKPSQEGDAGLDIPRRVFFEKGKKVVPQITVAMSDDTLYGHIAKGQSKDMPAGMTVKYSSNRPSIVSVAADQTITCAQPGVATITATVEYNGQSSQTDFIVYVNPDLMLSDIKVEGASIKGFDPATKQYNVAVPYGTNQVPTVTATAAGTSVVSIEPATDIPGITTVTVSDSGFSSTYIVGFGRPPRSSEFKEATALDSWWNILRQDAGYSLDPETGIKITTDQATLTPVNNIKNLVLQPASGDFVAQTSMSFSATPTANNQQGGLILYQDDSNYVKLVYERLTGNTNRVAMYNISNGTSTLVTGNTNSATQTQMLFRLTKNGNTVSAQWSTNGITWNNYSGTTTVNFTNPQLGLIATHGAATASIAVTYEYLRVGSLESAKPFASKIQRGGVDIAGFDPNVTTYDLVVPRDAILEDYIFTGEAGDPNWVCTEYQAESIPGIASVVVSTPVGSTTYTFKLNYKVDSFNFLNSSLEKVKDFWTINNEAPENYELKPGMGLRLPTLKGDIYGTNRVWNNAFTAPAGGNWDIVTKVYFPVAPNATYQQTMLLAWQDEDNYIKVDAERGGSGIVVQAGRELSGTFSGVGSSSISANGDGSLTIYFRLTKSGNQYQGSYSFNGIDFMNVGTLMDVNLNNIQVGVFATKNTDNAIIDSYIEYIQVLSGTEQMFITPAEMKLNATKEVSKYVKSLLPESIEFTDEIKTIQLGKDMILPPSYTISYESSNPDILSSTGLITQPAQPTDITYTYTVVDGTNDVKSEEIKLIIPGTATKEQADLILQGIPATITYGDEPFTLVTTGGTGTGTVTYEITAGDAVSVEANSGIVTINHPGTASITVTKAGDAEYLDKKLSIEITVQGFIAVTTITTLPTVENTVYVGDPLSTAKLTGGVAKAKDVVVEGSFVWSQPDSILTESDTYEVTFVPKDTINYLPSTTGINVTAEVKDNTVSAPSILVTPDAQQYSNDAVVSVSLSSSTEGANIYYTVDGSDVVAPVMVGVVGSSEVTTPSMFSLEALEVTTSSMFYLEPLEGTNASIHYTSPFEVKAPSAQGGAVIIKTIAVKGNISSVVSQKTLVFLPEEQELTYAVTIMAGVGGTITVGANGDYKEGTVINISA